MNTPDTSPDSLGISRRNFLKMAGAIGAGVAGLAALPSGSDAAHEPDGYHFRQMIRGKSEMPAEPEEPVQEEEPEENEANPKNEGRVALPRLVNPNILRYAGTVAHSIASLLAQDFYYSKAEETGLHWGHCVGINDFRMRLHAMEQLFPFRISAMLVAAQATRAELLSRLAPLVLMRFTGMLENNFTRLLYIFGSALSGASGANVIEIARNPSVFFHKIHFGDFIRGLGSAFSMKYAGIDHAVLFHFIQKMALIEAQRRGLPLHPQFHVKGMNDNCPHNSPVIFVIGESVPQDQSSDDK